MIHHLFASPAERCSQFLASSDEINMTAFLIFFFRSTTCWVDIGNISASGTVPRFNPSSEASKRLIAASNPRYAVSGLGLLMK